MDPAICEELRKARSLARRKDREGALTHATSDTNQLLILLRDVAETPGGAEWLEGK
jgi:hypothetical protein